MNYTVAEVATLDSNEPLVVDYDASKPAPGKAHVHTMTSEIDASRVSLVHTPPGWYHGGHQYACVRRRHDVPRGSRLGSGIVPRT